MRLMLLVRKELRVAKGEMMKEIQP